MIFVPVVAILFRIKMKKIRIRYFLTVSLSQIEAKNENLC